MVLINNKFFTIFLLSFLFFLFGCKNNSFEKDLIDYIENSCDFLENNSCHTNLEKFTKNKFDSILIFDAGATEYDISKVLKYKYINNNIIDDECKRIMFISKGKIIKEGDVANNKMCFLETEDVVSKQGKSFYYCQKYIVNYLFIRRIENYDGNNVSFYYSFSKIEDLID